jgi:uncharacterized protein YndB with AHSA1/START domain
MARSTPSSAHTTLTLRRVFSASIERVFEAWTKAEVLASWFGPVGFTVTASEIDLRKGGEYLIVLRSPDGMAIKHFGEYVEVTPPERLVFTWRLENQACRGSKNQCAETLVSIDFKRVDASTEIRLTHEHLPNKEAYDGHEFGWSSTFDSFDNFLLTRLVS